MAHEGDVAVSQEVKQVLTCEQKVTFCDEELPNIAAGQDRYAASKLDEDLFNKCHIFSSFFLFQAVTESEDRRSLCFTMS